MPGALLFKQVFEEAAFALAAPSGRVAPLIEANFALGLVAGGVELVGVLEVLVGAALFSTGFEDDAAEEEGVGQGLAVTGGDGFLELVEGGFGLVGVELKAGVGLECHVEAIARLAR